MHKSTFFASFILQWFLGEREVAVLWTANFFWAANCFSFQLLLWQTISSCATRKSRFKKSDMILHFWNWHKMKRRLNQYPWGNMYMNRNYNYSKIFLYILCSWHAFHCHRHHAVCSFSYSFTVKVLMLKMISVLSGILLEKTMCPWNLLRIHNSTVFVDCHNNFYMELLSIKY